MSLSIGVQTIHYAMPECLPFTIAAKAPAKTNKIGLHNIRGRNNVQTSVNFRAFCNYDRPNEEVVGRCDRTQYSHVSVAS